MELSDITGMEPSHTVSVFFEVFSRFRWIFEVATVHNWTANNNLSSGVRFIRNIVITFTM